MTNYLLTGGGTAGHVNPLLALADYIKSHEPKSEIYALGTKEGLEVNLVPARGFELLTIAKLPFPRKPGRYAFGFPVKFAKAVADCRRIIREKKIDVVVGFGGYASAPAYLAARLEKKKLLIHEANALPGIANKFGARIANRVAVVFENTRIAKASVIGMPLRAEIEKIANDRDKSSARKYFELDPNTVTLLVTGGSLGAKKINEVIVASKDLLLAAGVQILHIVGGKSELAEIQQTGYRSIKYCDRMDLAISAADFAIARAGAATVSEFSAVGLPALYIPYPVGNGEQKHNIVEVLQAGGAVTVADADFDREFVASTVVPLISNTKKLMAMALASSGKGRLGATKALFDLIQGVLSN